MHTWLLRHRARLRLIYGLSAPTPPEREAREESAPTEKREVKRLRGSKHRQAAGTVLRRRTYVLLAPMPRKSA